MTTPMRIAWFSPLPPVRSGIAAYSADLVPRARADARDRLLFRGRTRATFVWKARRDPYDLVVYQLGNAPCHDYMWGYLAALSRARRAARRAAAPGARARACSSRSGSTTTGASSGTTIRTRRRDFAEYAVAGLGGPIYYCWPMLRVVMRTARLVAVHNPRVAADLRDAVSRRADRSDPPGHARRCDAGRRGARARARGARRAGRRGAVRRVRQDHGGEADRRDPARVRRARARARRRPPAARRRRVGLPGARRRSCAASAYARARPRHAATCRTRRSATTSRRRTRASACGGRRRSKRRRRGCSAWRRRGRRSSAISRTWSTSRRSIRAAGARRTRGRAGGDRDRSAGRRRVAAAARCARSPANRRLRESLARARARVLVGAPHARRDGGRLPSA